MMNYWTLIHMFWGEIVWGCDFLYILHDNLLQGVPLVPAIVHENGGIFFSMEPSNNGEHKLL